MHKYAVCKYDTPVLNTKDFKCVYGGKDGKMLKFNESRLVKELEYVAFPGTVCDILEEFPEEDHFIYKVHIKEYDIILGGTGLYVDSRFTELSAIRSDERKVTLPHKDQIFEYFERASGAMYVWGGNNINGVEKMKEFYKPSDDLEEFTLTHWMIKGVDCSGLLYEATNGYTPRNTYQLVNYGTGLEIKNKSVNEIIKILNPLDMIVWKGHVIFVYDNDTTIESAHSAGGVVKKELIKVLEDLLKLKKPENNWNDNEDNIFLIRRWFNDNG